jgi:hypothetical protein
MMFQLSPTNIKDSGSPCVRRVGGVGDSAEPILLLEFKPQSGEEDVWSVLKIGDLRAPGSPVWSLAFASLHRLQAGLRHHVHRVEVWQVEQLPELRSE